ncbi:hypothetical protein ACFX2C_003646 [Malus domestica]
MQYCSAYIRREISMGNRCPHKNCDVAPLTFIGLRNEKVNGKLLTFAGACAWTTQEVIRLFECTNDVADRLAFSEVSS